MYHPYITNLDIKLNNNSYHNELTVIIITTYPLPLGDDQIWNHDYTLQAAVSHTFQYFLKFRQLHNWNNLSKDVHQPKQNCFFKYSKEKYFL